MITFNNIKKPARTVYVAKQNGDFSKISSAVNSIKNLVKFSTPYVVIVAPGLYRESKIDIPANVYIKGEDGKSVRVAADIEYEIRNGLSEDLSSLPIQNIYLLSPEDNTNDTWDGKPLIFKVYRIIGYKIVNGEKQYQTNTAIFSDGGNGSNWEP